MITLVALLVKLNTGCHTHPFWPIDHDFVGLLEDTDVINNIFVHHPAAISKSVSGIISFTHTPLVLRLATISPGVRGLPNNIPLIR